MTAQISSARAVLAVRDFRLYALLGFFTAILQQSQMVAVGWDIYERTGSALALGWVGLVQFVPMVVLILPAGQVADRHDRRLVMSLSQAAYATASVGLAAAAWLDAPMGWIYACLAFSSIAQTLNRPSRDALLPQLVPATLLSNAVALNSSLFQFAWIAGPALAGVIIAATGGALAVYLLNLVLSVIAMLLALAIGPQPRPATRPAITVKELFAGFVHVWRTRLVLGVLAVDLLTVMFAGVSALLPVFAKDILEVGPVGLGCLSSAPAFGAMTMGIIQGYWRPRHAGRAFLGAVAGFGCAVLVFGVSQNYWLSLAALVVTGALDNLSVVLRHTAVQLHTPDALRGRVSAVNRVFVDSSNYLGQLRAGLLTAATTPVATVVAGGFVTLVVVLATLRLFPEIRRLERL